MPATARSKRYPQHQTWFRRANNRIGCNDVRISVILQIEFPRDGFRSRRVDTTGMVIVCQLIKEQIN